MHHPTERIVHHSLCYTSHGALATTRNRSTMRDRSDDLSHMSSYTGRQDIFLFSYIIAHMVNDHSDKECVPTKTQDR